MSKGREGNNAVALWSSVGIVRRSSEDLGRELPWRPSVPIIVEGATEVVRYHTEVPWSLKNLALTEHSTT